MVGRLFYGKFERSLAQCLAVTTLLLLVFSYQVVPWHGFSAHGMQVLTWNVAAINDNPFEYWITYDNLEYNSLMDAVQRYIQTDADGQEPEVGGVFTPAMFEELMESMSAEEWEWLDEVRERWDTDFKGRKIISGFLKDKALGSKRLASMPDRVTNTIRTQDLGTVHRPTVINCYDGVEFSGMDSWWMQWKSFMFEQEVLLHGAEVPVKVSSLLLPIKAKKYPAVTAAEEKMSIPLQMLAQAIFDAIMVYMMGAVTPDHSWQPLRKKLCEGLNARKGERTLEVLSAHAERTAVAFVQESAASLATSGAREWMEANPSPWLERFAFLKPAKTDSRRDQNSLILLAKEKWKLETVTEVTRLVNSHGADAVAEKEGGEGDKPAKAPWGTGDAFALTASDMTGQTYLLGSFHGDTNGLLTVPFVSALLKTRAQVMRASKV